MSHEPANAEFATALRPSPAERATGTAPLAGTGDAAGQMALWLLAAALRLADWVEATLPALYARHPHLAGFRAAAAQVAPGLPTAAWPARLDARERTDGAAFPMARAVAALGLSDAQRLAHAIAALAEEDARIGALLVELQGGGDPYPSIETLTRVLCAPDAALGAGWDMVAPLLDAGLLAETRTDGPRARRCLAPVPAVWDLARGAAHPDLPAGMRLRRRADAPRFDALAYRPAFRELLARIPAALQPGGARYVLLRHMPGADAEEVAAALARALGRDLLVANRTTSVGRSVTAVALLTDALPFFTCDLGPGETCEPPDLSAWTGPGILSLGRDGGLAPEADGAALSVSLPFPGPTERARAWTAALGSHPVEGFDAIRDRFQLPLGHLRRVVSAAKAEARLNARPAVTPEDVRIAARALGREQLDGLAELLPDGVGWDELVVPEPTRLLLNELAARCAHRERLPDRLGITSGHGAGRGVRALFTGPSGTGKTLAARLLGAEIGKDVYRVDLSAVVDKYVGETEKRLNRLMSRAEALDVVLLLDEGDGLMARRTDVRSANDRFANLETNYLLQRLETHEGIVIVTTNMPEGIDQAFQRRMDVVVPFPRPTAEARLALWRTHLPPNHAVPDALLMRLAARAPLTGGQVRNAVRAAASLALAETAPLGEAHLMRGLDRELQKTGAMIGIMPGDVGAVRPGTALAAFAAALGGGRS